MRVFVIHRSHQLRKAKSVISVISKSNRLGLKPRYLKCATEIDWKRLAEQEIFLSEAVIVFSQKDCSESENARWEIDKAKSMGKAVVYIEDSSENVSALEALTEIRDFNSEFESCFNEVSPDSNLNFELYKIMVETSEELIRRRQITNGFFITLIGGIVSVSGYLTKEGIVATSSVWLLFFPTLVGILLCRSWRNLIENYGKLNRGKFRVIHKIESQFDAKIFSAEWIALGKGARPEKYRSFTETEKRVPLLFEILLGLLFLVIAWRTDWQEFFDLLTSLISIQLCG